MRFVEFRRWCGFAAAAGGLLLILASLTMLATVWAGDSVALASTTLLILAKFLVVLVLIGVYLYGGSTRGIWLAGFLFAVLGVQIDLANFYSPLGTVSLLIGLGLLAAGVSLRAPKLRMGLWGWFGANLLAFVSAVLGFRLLLVFAISLAGVSRILIGLVLLKLGKKRTRPYRQVRIGIYFERHQPRAEGAFIYE